MKEEKKAGTGQPNPGQQRRLEFWAGRLSEAKACWEEKRQNMERWERLYNGTHEVEGSGSGPARRSNHVRNIVYELVESQTDSTVPLPKVTAIHEEDRELARKIEAYLRGEVVRLGLEVKNDAQERTVPIQGGGWWEVGWEPLGGTHCCPGALAVESRHPKLIVPQPGVYDPEQMDYLFECLPRSRKSLERAYGVKLEDRAGTEADPEEKTVENEMRVQNIAFYRDEEGTVQRFSWVDDIVLEDESTAVTEMMLTEDVKVKDSEGRLRTVWRAAAAEEAAPRKLARYRMKEYPLVLRRNVSREGQLLGASDVEQIADQQEALKKMGAKIQEKILKGGSYVTLPQSVGVETTDRELKIIRLKSPAEKALIDVLNIQPDVSKEMAAAAQCYDWAKSTLGITDSYQGKADHTAQSGTAKQFAANQSAGRLQSKRVMKNAAYGELYKRMFHMLLACADAPMGVRRENGVGEVEYGHLDPLELLRMDNAGELYWNDEFLFGTDSGTALTNNRQAMWEETRTNFTGGAFGSPASTEAQIAYWTVLSKHEYPGAEDVKAMLEERREQEVKKEHEMSLVRK